MLLFLQLLIVTHSQLIQILTGQEAIIDTFTSSGIILQQNLTDQNLCQIIPQQLVANNIDDQSITLISGYTDDEFEQKFEYGSYKGTFAKLLQFVQIENGVLVLSDDGIIKYLEYKAHKFTVKTEFSLDIPQISGKVFMQYFYFQKQVIIIGQGFTLVLDLEQDQEDLFIQKYKLYDLWEVNHINSITTAGNIMLVAMDSGIKLFEFKDYMLNEIVIEYLKLTNVQDIKIFNKNNSDIYRLFILDKIEGVRSFVFNLKNLEINYDSKLGVIPYRGEVLDVLDDIVMIVKGQILYEFKLNQQLSSYQLIKKHELDIDIIDIQLTDNFVIVIGKNSHQIIFHSIPPDYKTFEWQNQLVIPNLKQLDIYALHLDLQTQSLKDLDYHNFVIGITQHTFFYTQVKLQQSYISCFSNEITDEIQLQYQQQSTFCAQNLRKQQCLFQKDYQIQFVEPQQFGGNKKTCFILIGLYLICMLLFLSLMTILVIKFYQFKRHQQNEKNKLIDSNNVTQNIKTGNNQNHCELQSEKIIPISRDDQTPISEIRDQMNTKLNNNRPITQENCDMSPVVSEIR